MRGHKQFLGGYARLGELHTDHERDWLLTVCRLMNAWAIGSRRDADGG